MTAEVYKTPDEFFYRCAFPRARVLSQLEDDLTIFAQLIVKYSHKPKVDFDLAFDAEYSKYTSGSDKTIHNHRTEMIRLYGQTIVSEDGLVEPSLRTLLLVEKQDFYQFFKIFCLKFQFPNCINKSQFTIEQMSKKIRFKPAQFILKLYLLGIDKFGPAFSISGNEISNIVFNDLRVTTGKMTPEECLDTLVFNRENGVLYEGGSNLNQHGREFLGYMRLANILSVNASDSGFILNKNEMTSINKIIQDTYFFDFPKDFSESSEARKSIGVEWDKWYGSVTDDQLEASKTSIEVIEEIGDNTLEPIQPAIITSSQPLASSYKDIGDLGEKLVLKYEKDTIGKIRPDKVGLVQKVSNDTVLGFDIQSFEFDDLGRKKYIEVKTTNRTYPPNLDILTSFPMSSNEWETARNYQGSYYIYRVFLLGKAVKMFVVKDPIKEHGRGNIILEPHEYRVILKRESGSFTD